jgi:hypothetical protein
MKSVISLFASTDAWTLMARSAGAGKVRHIRRPGPMRTVTIKLTIEGLVGNLFVVLHPTSLAVPTDTKVSIDTIVR